MTPNRTIGLPNPSALTGSGGVNSPQQLTNFHWLWRAQTSSLIGSQIGLLAFQVTAASVLHASAGQMGVLTAAQTAPYMLLSLFVGVAADRWPKRTLLIVACIARVLILAVLGTLAGFARLNIPMLCGGTFLLSTFNLVFDAATGAYVPWLVGRTRYLWGNTRLAVTQSGSEVAGPGLGGLLIQLSSAPLAILLDSFSYLLSVTWLWSIREVAVPEESEPQRQPATSGAGALLALIRALVEGVVFVSGNGILRAFAVWSAAWNFSWSAVLSVFVLYATRTHSLSAGMLGAILACGGLGGILGAISGGSLVRRFTRGKVFVWAPLLGACGGSLLLAPGGRSTPVLMAVAMFFYNAGESIFGINMQTTRQEVTPMPLMARMDTTMRFCFRGMASLGALAGGCVGSHFGLQGAIQLGVLGLFVTVIGLSQSPLAKLRTLPGHEPAAQTPQL